MTLQACLEDERLMAYATALVSLGLLEEMENGRFRITDTGRRFLEDFEELLTVLDEDMPFQDSSPSRQKILRRYR